MTITVGEIRRPADAEVRAIGARESHAADGEPAVELAAERGVAREGVESADAARRAERAHEDQRAFERAARALGVLGNPQAMFHLLQSQLRDLQLGQREQEARTADSRAEIQSRVREEQLERADEAERQRAESATAGNIFAAIAAGLALVAGAVSAAFTGGAGLVAAIGLAIAVLGPLVCNVLANEGVMDPTAACVTSAVFAAVGTALSFGAGAAASAPTVGAQIAQTTVQVLNVAAAAAQAGQGASQIAGAVFTGDYGHATAFAREADHRVDAEMQNLDEAAEAVADITRQFGRLARKLRQVSEASDAALRAAASFRA